MNTGLAKPLTKLHVLLANGSWTVRGDNPRVEDHYASRDAAVAAAIKKLNKQGGVLIDHGLGTRTERVVVSSDNFEKISAIEGLELTPEMRSHLVQLENEGLSAKELALAILRKFGKPAR